jgi:hypothetical protein
MTVISSPAMVRVCRARARAAHAANAMIAAALAVAGCGPVLYARDVTRDASAAVAAARTANAEKYAPYWWTLATEYLRKAQEVAAHADFQGANRFGRLATQAARQAVEEAKLAERDPSKRPRDMKPDVAPARDAPSPPAPARDAPSPPAPAKDAPRPAPAKDAPRPAPAKDAP